MFHNSTDKFRSMKIGSKWRKNYHQTWGDKPHIQKHRVFHTNFIFLEIITTDHNMVRMKNLVFVTPCSMTILNPLNAYFHTSEFVNEISIHPVFEKSVCLILLSVLF